MRTLLPAPDEKYWEYKEIFHTFPFQNCFVFHLIMLFLGFLVLSDLLEPAFEKSNKENC